MVSVVFCRRLDRHRNFAACLPFQFRFIKDSGDPRKKIIVAIIMLMAMRIMMTMMNHALLPVVLLRNSFRCGFCADELCILLTQIILCNVRMHA